MRFSKFIVMMTDILMMMQTLAGFQTLIAMMTSSRTDQGQTQGQTLQEVINQRENVQAYPGEVR